MGRLLHEYYEYIHGRDISKIGERRLIVEMNKDEFLRQLEQLLGNISPEERADAMAYYRSYFEDAGIENEASILKELESPQKVAQSILKDAGVEDGVQPKDGVRLEKENRMPGSDHYSYGNTDGGYKSASPGSGSTGCGYGSSNGSYASGYGSSNGSYASGYGSSKGSCGSRKLSIINR